MIPKLMLVTSGVSRGRGCNDDSEACWPDRDLQLACFKQTR